MSPSFVNKYLDAAKEVASHAVLAPDGIAFSEFTSRRDWTDERVAKIRRFYDRYTVSNDVYVEVGGAGRIANRGGAIPLARYLAATLEERDALMDGSVSTESVARKRGINAKYLTTLWATLVARPNKLSLPIDPLRRQWREAASTDVDKLVSAVGHLQEAAFRYNLIGHIGSDGKQVPWLAPHDPIVSRRQFDLMLPESDGDVSVFLSASDAGDGNDEDYVVWQNARLTTQSGPDIPLRDLVGLERRLTAMQRETLSLTSRYLAAAAALQASHLPVPDVAAQHRLETSILKAWANYLGIGPEEPVVVTGHFKNTETHGDYDFIKSWGTGQTPIVTANSSDTQVRIPGIARPNGITAHPSPTQFAAIGWQSPVDGLVRIEARIADAHPECGDGQEWFLQYRTSQSTQNLWTGSFGVAGTAEMEPQLLSVERGDLISFIIGPGSGDHACDLAEMKLAISEVEGQQRVWDLARDVSEDILAGNPHSDTHGNATTWHFYKGDLETLNQHVGPFATVPAGSILARWQTDEDPKGRRKLAEQIEQLAIGESPADPESPDGILYRHLHELALAPHSLELLLDGVEIDTRFGSHPLGHAVKSSDLVVRAPSIVEFRIPARLAAGRTFVVGAMLDGEHGRNGTVRIEAGLKRIEPAAIPLTSPVIVNEHSEAYAEVVAGFNAFRELFPPHLCYNRIVPVDEVVTLTLFYRQDDRLQRLMLSDAEVDELNRLWDDLLYVAQEPLRFEVAFEQIREFASQDRPDLVEKWDPLIPTVVARANAFRKRLVESESAHLRGVIEFAGRAWRRRLSMAERDGIARFYQELRAREMDHEQAIRLTIVRVLTSPDFLYRREVEPEVTDSRPVSQLELATRLSFFLWSSTPDRKLLSAAYSDTLHDDDVLLDQTRRMLSDPKTRRLAIQFAAQWLHLRDFDQNDDKNESLYPEFAELRDDMYEETILFFEDMFRNDRSILDLLGADHTYLNETLARHYGVDGVTGTEWRRVDGVQVKGRGGVLGMAALLASQSGASRTSPILRGNWIYETLLGERLPRPPANVPQLPQEVPLGLTARELIEQHSSVSACAKCHARIDPYGFALEQYDAIGRLRPEKVDTSTKLANGLRIAGIDGLRHYLSTERRADVVRQFCRKLLGFALGREIQLSDEPLLDKMGADLENNVYRFGVAVDAIVTSSQFRQIRGRDWDQAHNSN